DVPTRVVGVVRGLLRLVVEGDAERRGGGLRLAIGTRGPRQRRRGRGAVGAGGTGRHATARERLDLDDVADRALDPVAQPRHRVVTARTDLREEYRYAGGEEGARRGPEREERLVTEGAPETRRVLVLDDLDATDSAGEPVARSDAPVEPLDRDGPDDSQQDTDCEATGQQDHHP